VVSIEPPKERKRLLGPGDNLPGAFARVELGEGNARERRDCVANDYWRPEGALLITPYSADFVPAAADKNPSAANPRLSSSRTAAALLGMRRLKRKSSSATNSSSLSMI
jgi:hypothetical protein